MSAVNRREEAPTLSWESKGSGVILDEGMVSDLLSGDRKCRALKLANGGLKNIE